MLKIPEGRKLDCIPVGRLAIDINPADMTESFAECLHFKKYVGGSPANTAVGLAKLGARAGFIGKVSSDSLGDFAVDYVKNLGVDVTNVSRAPKEVPIGLAFTETLNGKTNLMMYRNSQVADLLSPRGRQRGLHRLRAQHRHLRHGAFRLPVPRRVLQGPRACQKARPFDHLRHRLPLSGLAEPR